MCGMLTAVSQPASKITLAVDIPHQLPARQDWPGGRAQAKQQHTPSVCSACADPLASPTPAGPAPQAPDTPVHPSRQPEPAGAGHAPQQHMPHMLSHGRSPDAAAEVPAGLEAAQQPAYNAPKLRISVADFDILQRLGDGSFSTVMLARYKGNGQQYAVKIVNKTLVLRNKMAEYIRNERNVLDKLHHPGIAELHFTFQDDDSLYMGLEYCANGELYQQMQERGPLPLRDAVQYAAEIVDTLSYLRSQEVIHRDLKPENLLLDAAGHLKLIDFGSAKALYLPPAARSSTGNQSRATSFVGTAEYVSPEVLNNSGICYASDLWALGCIVYQMLVGRPPFKGRSEYLTFQLITSREFAWPTGDAALPAAAQDLIDRLLQLEPQDRLGYRCIDEVKQHPFFAGVAWDAVRQAPAPPVVSRPEAGRDDLSLDWELMSLFRQANPAAVKYEYLPSGATV